VSIRASVVVRCYNEEQHIGRLLNGIMQQTVKDIEIILVDSGSTDGTLSIASSYPTKILSIRPAEFSFGRALNKGCEAAKGEFIIIASGHVYPSYNDWIEKLMAPFDDPNIALAYGKQRGNETTKYSEHQVFAKWFPDKSNLHLFHPFCNNANAAIPRSLWERMAYDERLTGLEDLDWAKRSIELGFKIAYTADAEVVHVHNESPRGIYNRYRREAIALKRIFPQEQFNGSDFVRLFTANVASDCYHAFRERVLGHNLVSISVFRLMQFWGTYRGFAQRGPITSQLKRTLYYPNGLKRSERAIAPLQKSRLIEYTEPGKEVQVGRNP
jgi:rhamnosyltransferase